MGAQAFGRGTIPTSGLSTVDSGYDQLVGLAGQLLEVTEDGLCCAGALLAELATLVERHASRVERLLQRADSRALGAARRGHEALLLHLEELQELTGEPADAIIQLQAVCGYLLAILVQDAAAVRRCGCVAVTPAMMMH